MTPREVSNRSLQPFSSSMASHGPPSSSISSPPPAYVSSYLGHSSQQSKSPKRISPRSRVIEEPRQSTSRIVNSRPDILRLRNVVTPERQRALPVSFPAHLEDEVRTPASIESEDADDDTGSSEGLSGYYPPPPEPAPPDFLPSSSMSVAAAAAASVTQGILFTRNPSVLVIYSILDNSLMKYSNCLPRFITCIPLCSFSWLTALVYEIEIET